MTESSTAFFRQGQYIPGVAGIHGAQVVDTDVVVSVGSGSYAFIVQSA